VDLKDPVDRNDRKVKTMEYQQERRQLAYGLSKTDHPHLGSLTGDLQVSLDRSPMRLVGEGVQLFTVVRLSSTWLIFTECDALYQPVVDSGVLKGNADHPQPIAEKCQ